MALADFAAYVAALNQHALPCPASPVGASAFTWVPPFWRTCFLDTAPGSAVVPAQSEGLGQTDAGTGRLTVMGLDGSILTGGTRTNQGWAFIYDCLSRQSGLSGTSTSAQTTNLPTAALTRYTSGVGVMLAYQVYTALGTSSTTMTVSYTNQAGTAGRTVVCPMIGGSSDARKTPGNLIPLQLGSGDTGIRSVESVTLAATTGVAGNWGFSLIKPIAMIPLGRGNPANLLTGILGGLEEVLDGACLSMAVTLYGGSTVGGGSTTTPFQGGYVHLAEL